MILVRRRVVALLAPAVLVVAVSACAESAAPTKDEYVAVANSVCRGADERLDALYEAYEVAKYEAAASGEPSTYVDRPDRWVRGKVVPEYKRLLGGLRGIQPPDGDGAYLADIYADLARRIEVLHNHPGQGRAVIEDDAGLRTRFTSYGLVDCPTPAGGATVDGEAEAAEPQGDGATTSTTASPG